MTPTQLQAKLAKLEKLADQKTGTGKRMGIYFFKRVPGAAHAIEPFSVIGGPKTLDRDDPNVFVLDIVAVPRGMYIHPTVPPIPRTKYRPEIHHLVNAPEPPADLRSKQDRAVISAFGTQVVEHIEGQRIETSPHVSIGSTAAPEPTEPEPEPEFPTITVRPDPEPQPVAIDAAEDAEQPESSTVAVSFASPQERQHWITSRVEQLVRSGSSSAMAMQRAHLEASIAVISR